MSAEDIKAGIMNTSWNERELYSGGNPTSGLSRSRVSLKLGNDNVLISKNEFNDLALKIRDIDTTKIRNFPVYAKGKVFFLTADQVAAFQVALINQGINSPSVLLTILNALWVEEVDLGETEGTLTAKGISGDTNAAIILGSVASPNLATPVTKQIFDATGETEKTETDPVIDTDILVVTAEDGITTWDYVITYNDVSYSTTIIDTGSGVVISEITEGETAGTVVLEGASETTAADLLEDVAGVDADHPVTLEIYDSTKVTEKTGTDELIAGDVLVVTAEDGETTWDYVISYAGA